MSIDYPVELVTDGCLSFPSAVIVPIEMPPEETGPLDSHEAPKHPGQHASESATSDQNDKVSNPISNKSSRVASSEGAQSRTANGEA